MTIKRTNILFFYKNSLFICTLFALFLYLRGFKVFLLRKKGCIVEYQKERDTDLLRAYWSNAKSCRGLSSARIMEKAILSPSKRFWVSEARAAAVVGKIIRGEKVVFLSPQKEAMYKEITFRTLEILKNNPKKSITSVVAEVVLSEAPQFYLTLGSAIVLFYRALHRREKR